MEGNGWLNAARYMREAAFVLEEDDRSYATLRVALRHAIQRVAGLEVSDIAKTYRAIEAGMSLGDATDELERLLREITVKRPNSAPIEPTVVAHPGVPYGYGPERPDNCRNALRDAGKMHPRSGCDVCGNGGLMGCPYEKGRS